jgi:hypothetical protein
VDGDGLNEALLSWSTGTNARLCAFNQKAWPLKEFTFHGNINWNRFYGTNFTRLTAVRLTDLEKDGRKELLAVVTSSWGLRPRGLCCFDVETAELKWFFETANFVTEAETRDLDGDGRMEVLLGSCSPANYPEGQVLPDGSDDRHAYSYAVTSEGKLLWRRELGGAFTSVHPLAVGAGSGLALVWVAKDHAWSAKHQEPDTGKVVALDSQGEIVRDKDFKLQLTSALIVDFEQDGRPEVVVADRLGRVHILDGKLAMIRSQQIVTNQFDEVDLRLWDAGPLGPSGEPWLLFTSTQIERKGEQFSGNNPTQVPQDFYHDNRVILTDGRLRLIAERLLAEKWSVDYGLKAAIAPMKPGPPAQLVVLGLDKADVFQLKKAKLPLFRRTQPK